MGVVTFPRVAMDNWSKGKNYCTKEVEVDGMHPVFEILFPFDDAPWLRIILRPSIVLIYASICHDVMIHESLHVISFEIIITLLHPVCTAANYKCEACYEKYASLRAGLPNLP